MNIRHTIKPSGPGNNVFLKENVEVRIIPWTIPRKIDEITLKVKHNGPFNDMGWSCAEVSWPAKEGIYEFDLECPVFLPKGIVCGVFLYQDDKNELDIEFGRWNKTFNKNCQFANQHPFKVKRFWNFQRNNKIRIEWKKDWVTLTLNGKGIEYNTKSKFERLIVNLWIYGQPAESQVKIKNFKFK